MRKLLTAGLAVTLVLALAAVAVARTNQYTVTGDVTPSVKGSAKNPVPVAVEFDYDISEAAGLRPAPVAKYSIKFAGLRVNTNRFPGCTAKRINGQPGATPSAAGCSRARVGGGKIQAVAGPSNDETATCDFDTGTCTKPQAVRCELNLDVYNGRRNKAALYITGGPDAPAGKKTNCPQTQNAAIDANFVRSGNGVALVFTVPEDPFRSQLNGAVEVSVVHVDSSIQRKVTRYRGNRIGFFEAIGGCRAGRRAITVTFTSEEGQSQPASANANC